jgi:hypothetical protein
MHTESKPVRKSTVLTLNRHELGSSEFVRAILLPMILIILKNFGQELTMLDWHGVQGGAERAYRRDTQLLIQGCFELHFWRMHAWKACCMMNLRSLGMVRSAALVPYIPYCTVHTTTTLKSRKILIPWGLNRYIFYSGFRCQGWSVAHQSLAGNLGKRCISEVAPIDLCFRI